MSHNSYFFNNSKNIRSINTSLSYVFNPDGIENELSITGTLLYVAISKYDVDWLSLPHSHTFSEIFYITSGAGIFTVNGKEVKVQTHDLIMLNPMMEHSEVSIGSKPLEYIVLGVDGLSFEAKYKEYILLQSTALQSNFPFYFNSLALEMKTNNQYRTFFCQNLLNIIFTLIIRNEALELSIVSGPTLSKECALAKNYMDEHFQENITLDTLSSYVHLNKYYFVHTFSKEYGISPINYLLEKRIKESKYLLSTTNHSLSTISRIVGFSSGSYFSQSFRRATNMSPLEYRKKQTR